jgi:hypothetical protein
MLRSFQRLASEPDAPVKQQATKAKDPLKKSLLHQAFNGQL